MSVLGVYLDLDKWIDLARAPKGEAAGARFRDLLDLARASVAAGIVSFPLDSSRYMETAKRGNWQSGQELVATMAEPSLFHTLAPVNVILPAEIDAALHRRFGRPLVPRRVQVFGKGVGHAAGGGIRTDGRRDPNGRNTGLASWPAASRWLPRPGRSGDAGPLM
jgi:hypothetical protein